MGENGGTSDSERITYLEEEVKALRKQAESLAGQVLGGAAILCLPIPRGRRLEIAFRQMKSLPNGFLGAIVRRYVAESRTSGLSLDDMLGPVVAALGLERTREIIEAKQLRETYGDYAALRWEEMAGASVRVVCRDALTDVIKAVYSYLFEMGYTPQAMRISSYDGALAQGTCKVSCTFQNGFFGECLGFDVEYDPTTGAAKRLCVTEAPPRIG